MTTYLPRESRIVAALAVVGALRVLVLASALPFFHINDEHQHVDAIHRYAQGQLPGERMSTLNSEVAFWSVRWGTFEYLKPGPDVPLPYGQRGHPPGHPELLAAVRAYGGVAATEFDSPPVFYMLAAGWYRLGTTLGFDGLGLLYWLRWADALVLAALVAGTALALRRVYPDRPLVRLGVPALLAFFPTDVLYAASVDAFAPLMGGVAFLAVVWAARSPTLRPARSALAGLALAAAFLTKYTNVAWVAVAAVVSLLRIRRDGRPAAPGLAALWVAAAIPVALWFARNLAVIGDLTGTHRKVAALEWIPRPMAEWLDHPLLTPAGLAHFLTELPMQFWRGELTWYSELMAHSGVDILYVATSFGFVAATAWHLRHRDRTPAHRTTEAVAVGAVVAAVGLLAVLSLQFDFPNWGTPTRDDPYFDHGRLITGVLVPFALVWVRGLEVMCSRLPEPLRVRVPALLLVAWLVGITASEAVLVWPVFSSPWNWFHAG